MELNKHKSTYARCPKHKKEGKVQYTVQITLFYKAEKENIHGERKGLDY